MTRRDVLGLVFTLPALAQDWRSGEEIEQGDTAIKLIDYGVGTKAPPAFGIGVRTKIDADAALVQVFYAVPAADLNFPAGQNPFEELIFCEERMAPIAGNAAYGATDLFSVPRGDIRFIKVKFFKTVTERRFGKPAK